MTTDIKNVKKALAELLDDRTRIDAATHQAHHEFIKMLVSKAENRAALVERIKQQVLLWSILAGLAWLGKVVYEALRQQIK